jgi:hypothetical protein
MNRSARKWRKCARGSWRHCWNPQQDDEALIREFLDGYYGAAGRPLARYLELMQKASQGFNLTCYAPTEAPFLSFKQLAQAESSWQKAEQAAGEFQWLAAALDSIR